MTSFIDLRHRLGLSLPANTGVARKAFILNVLLFGVIALLVVGICIHVAVMATHPLDPDTYRSSSLSLAVLALVFAGFALLYGLSLRGYSLFSSYLFVGALYGLAACMSLRWGVDVTVGILFYMLAIVMAGILVHTRFSVIVLVAVAAAIGVIGWLQESGRLVADHYWRAQPWSWSDTIMTAVILAIMATASALATWQTEHALERAEMSEGLLTLERDMLEETVERRTRELREVQAERMASVFRFAEFGRISSGLFHNLANLLTALTLNMDQLKESQVWEVDAAKAHLARALSINAKMRGFLDSVRRKLAGQRLQTVFSVGDEVRAALPIVLHKASAANVTIETTLATGGDAVLGDAVICNQIILNLVSNAIDAYAQVAPSPGAPRIVRIGVARDGDEVVLTVKDFGCGIAKDLQEKVFEPFFTTKPPAQGIGIGLAFVKAMVENDFKGRLHLESEEGRFTEFTARFPAWERK